MSLTVEEFERLEERDVRMWFIKTELTQAADTANVVQGIIETRRNAQPKQRRRKKEADIRAGIYEIPG